MYRPSQSWAIALVAAVATALMPAPSADAVPGYTVSNGPWNVRSCSSTVCDVIGTMPNGPIPDMLCQAYGEIVTIGAGRTPIWDKVRTPDGKVGFITDLAVNETPYGSFDPAVPRCTGIPRLAVYYQPRFSDGDPVPVGTIIIPRDRWSTGECVPASGNDFPEVTVARKVTTLSAWSLGRLGPTYLMAGNSARAATIDSIVLYDPGSYDDYFGEGSCDLEFDQSELYRRWLSVSSSHRLLILAGKHTKDADHPSPSGHLHRGIQEALFPKIRNTPLAQQVLVCNYDDLDHKEVLERFDYVAAGGPQSTCPTQPGVRLYAAWHP